VFDLDWDRAYARSTQTSGPPTSLSPVVALDRDERSAIDEAGRPDIMAVLRQRTREEHQAIEQALGLVDPDLTVADYTRIIGICYGFWRPLEEKLAAVEGLKNSGYDLAAREKTSLLRSDWHALAAHELSGLAVCSELPDVTSVAAAFGCLNVIEGATLGGQVISRHLQMRLGITPSTGAAFFHGYGKDTASMWKAFGAALGALARTPGSHEPIVESAIATFRALRFWSARTDIPRHGCRAI